MKGKAIVCACVCRSLYGASLKLKPRKNRFEGGEPPASRRRLPASAFAPGALAAASRCGRRTKPRHRLGQVGYRALCRIVENGQWPSEGGRGTPLKEGAWECWQRSVRVCLPPGGTCRELGVSLPGQQCRHADRVCGPQKSTRMHACMHACMHQSCMRAWASKGACT